MSAAGCRAKRKSAPAGGIPRARLGLDRSDGFNRRIVYPRHGMACRALLHETGEKCLVLVIERARRTR